MDGSPIKGTASWPNGNNYEGKFKDWERHGQGAFTWTDGHKLIGEFREDEPWETIEYDNNGKIIGKIVKGVETLDNQLKRVPKLEVNATH